MSKTAPVVPPSAVFASGYGNVSSNNNMMKKLLVIFSTLLLFGFTKGQVYEWSIFKLLKSEFIEDCGDDKKGCVAAVNMQLEACIKNSGIVNYIKKNNDRPDLEDYIGPIRECIVDDNGNSYFLMIAAKDEKENPLSKEEEKEFFKICLEKAKKNKPRYQYQLAVLYKKGKGTAKDDGKALYWWKQAAINNHVFSQNIMGSAYYTGSFGAYGYSQNYETAFNWYLRAAMQGSDSAQVMIGSMYKNGEGVEPNIEKAKEWWTKAANNGNERAKEFLIRIDSR